MSVPDPRHRTIRQMLRYLLAGGIAFVLDALTMLALTEVAGIHYLWSAAAGFIVGMLTNYAICIYWVFHQRKVKNTSIELLVFATTGLAGLFLNEVLIWICSDLAGLHYLLSKIIATAIIFLFNFFSRKILLF